MIRRVTLGATVGSIVEWFDVAVYGYLAVVIGQVFFASDDPTISLLSSFAVFAAAFIVRPRGGIFFGSLGDRIGRRKTLAAVILLVSATTFGIGVIPGYASTGLLAPVLLIGLRLLQEFSAGGEMVGASAFAAEFAPAHRRGFLVSLVGMALSPRDYVLTIVPMFHANAWGIPYAALMSGTSLLMTDRFRQPAPLLATMADQKPTFAAAVPSIWTGVLTELEPNPQDISHLREVIVGGSAAPPATMHAFEDEHGVRVIHAWGMTETSPLGSVAIPPPGLSAEEEWLYRISQGQFPAGVQARLIDDDGAIVPHDGESLGEVKGPWITGSYYSPETSGRSPPTAISPSSTGPRMSSKSGGEWISSVDLENAVMAHPDVLEAAVIGVPDAKVGRAAPGHGGLARGQHRGRRSPARAPKRQVREVAVAGALVVPRRRAQDERWQVRQEGASCPSRRGRPGDHDARLRRVRTVPTTGSARPVG